MLQDIINIIFYNNVIIQRILSWDNYNMAMNRVIMKYNITYKKVCRMHSMAIFKYIERSGEPVTTWVFIEAIKRNYLPMVKYIHSLNINIYTEYAAWHWCIKNNNNRMYKFLLSILPNESVYVCKDIIRRIVYDDNVWNMNKINLCKDTYTFFIYSAQRTANSNMLCTLLDKYHILHTTR